MSDRSSAPLGAESPLQPGSDRPWALGVFAAAVALFGTLGVLPSAGLWDPPELEFAEFSRRIAQGLLGASGIASPDEALPTRGELGRGELPFTSVALGFRLLGLSAWAGRVPLSVWALLGILALFWGMRRLVDARSGFLAVLVLATAPLYFLQARTLIGEVTTFVGVGSAMIGLCVLVFDARSRSVRWLSAAIALLALLVGFLSRGLLIGVAVPLLGVGLAWCSLALARVELDAAGRVLGAVVLSAGVAAAAAGVRAVTQTDAAHYSMLVGALTGGVRPAPTFETAFRDLGHAFFPWSALLPFAIGRVLAVRHDVQRAESQRDAGLRLSALSTAGVALLATGALATEVGPLAFPAPAALAVMIALSLRDFDRTAAASRAWGLGVAALALLLLLDFKHLPQKLLVAFALPSELLPESFSPGRWALLAGSSVAFSGLFLLLVQEAPARGSRVFDKQEYLRWPRVLRRLWAGNLAFALLVVECALVCFELLLFVSERFLRLPALEEVGEMTRLAVRGAWVLVLTICGAPPLALLARDALRVLLSPAAYAPRATQRWPALSSLHFARGTTAAVAAALCGATLSLVYYPALMRELSPKKVFDSYARSARAGEPLALLGARTQSVRYHAGSAVEQWSNPEAALDWLMVGPERRFLALRASDLPALNAGYRARSEPKVNLPIVDADSADLLLAVSRLTPGRANQNPLARFVLEQAPRPSRLLDVELGSSLTVLGWDILDGEGKAQNAISAGTTYQFVSYYRVRARLSGTWETFVHIDGFQRRYNADHQTLEGKYPFPYWQPGDFIADRWPLRVDATFPVGAYEVYFGLYSGSRRLEVRRGKHDRDRIAGGKLILE